MSLIHKFDKEYSLLGLLGFKSDNGKGADKRNKLTIKAEKNPFGNLENEIDYMQSLHTMLIQRSRFVKLDDNLLNIDFESHFNFSNKKLDDDRIKEMRDELNRVHLKYIS